MAIQTGAEGDASSLITGENLLSLFLALAIAMGLPSMFWEICSMREADGKGASQACDKLANEATDNLGKSSIWQGTTDGAAEAYMCGATPSAPGGHIATPTEEEDEALRAFLASRSAQRRSEIVVGSHPPKAAKKTAEAAGASTQSRWDRSSQERLLVDWELSVSAPVSEPQAAESARRFLTRLGWTDWCWESTLHAIALQQGASAGAQQGSAASHPRQPQLDTSSNAQNTNSVLGYLTTATEKTSPALRSPLQTLNTRGISVGAGSPPLGVA